MAAWPGRTRVSSVSLKLASTQRSVSATTTITGKLCLDALQVLLCRRDALAGDVEAHPRLLQLLLRGDLPLGELGLALEFLLGVVELALRRLDLLALGAPLRAKPADVGAG